MEMKKAKAKRRSKDRHQDCVATFLWIALGRRHTELRDGLRKSKRSFTRCP